MDEQQQIKDILAGEREQYRALVERYQTGLIIHCEQLVGNRADAEDIAQDTFIKAYEQLATFDSKKARFSTWLYRIATNKAIDYLRKNKRKIDVENIEELADTAPEPSLEHDEIIALREAIETLEPPKFSQIIQSYYWEGKSYEAIAHDFDTTTGTIGTWMSRAKSQLKEKLS